MDTQQHGADGAGEPYVVTRGKPPLTSQFKKGQSGNPRGRPRGTKDFRTILARELDRTIPATSNERTTTITRREAMVMKLVEKALKGDLKAMEAIMKLAQDDQTNGPALPPMDTDPGRDAEILASYLARKNDGAGHV